MLASGRANRPLGTPLGRYCLVRRQETDGPDEVYVAADRDATLVDIHLLAATQQSALLVRVWRTLTHLNLLRAIDSGTADGELFYVEEHAEGASLRELVQRGPLPGDVFLHVVALLSSLLAAAAPVAAAHPGVALRWPALDDILVSWTGQLKVSAAALLFDQSRSGKDPALESRAAMAGLIQLLLGPPHPGEDAVQGAARQLAAVMAKSRLSQEGYRELHDLALSALHRVVRSPDGEFAARKLGDLIDERAPDSALRESELACAAAQALQGVVPGGSAEACQRAPLGERGLRLPRSAPGARALGERLPGTPYRLIKQLGEGGLGLVYEAEHVDLGRLVAIKVLRGALGNDPRLLARFRQEARSAARVHHLGVVSINDFGTTGAGELYLVMERLHGRTLSALCAQGLLPIARAVALLRQVCAAVDAAHRAQVIHRDLKPENIMIVRAPVPGEGDGGHQGGEQVKVLDLGLAWLRESELLPGGVESGATAGHGPLVGTPAYMAPEQIQRQPVDHRADIYSLGCIAYELLTGNLPFRGDSHAATLAAHVLQQPLTLRTRAPELGIPPLLDRVVLRALAKRPNDRYRTMGELAEALGDALSAPLPLTPLTPDLTGPVVTPPRLAALELPAPAPAPAGSAVTSQGVWSTSSAATPQRAWSAPSGATPQEAWSAPSGVMAVPLRRPRAWLRPLLWGSGGLLLGLASHLWWQGRAGAPLRRPGERPAPVASARVEPPAQESPARRPGSAPGSVVAPRPEAEPPAALTRKGESEGPSAGERQGAPTHGSEGAPPSRSTAVEVLRQRPRIEVRRSMRRDPLAALSAPPSAEPAFSERAAAPPQPAPESEARPLPPAPPPPVLSPPPRRYSDGTLSWEVVSASGAYGKRDLQQGMASFESALRTCYVHAVQASPLAPPAGGGRLGFVINEDGYLTPGSLHGDGPLTALRPCLEGALRHARFTRPDIGPVSVSLRLQLQPR